MRANIARNAAAVEERIAEACRRNGRPRTSVTLVAVSKTFPAAAIDAATSAGISEIGENRVQEMRDKIDALARRPRLHLIGNLQSNKVKLAVTMFDVIQTADSESLVAKISKEALASARQIELLVEVNLGGESQKAGVEPQDAARLAEQVVKLKGVTLGGLMAIPPIGTADQARAHFRALRELRDRLSPSLPESFRHLSMGMSEDFELAIEEGATIVRIGRAIFGPRG